jgi:hypothetical protein
MALTENEKYMLISILAVLMFIVLYFEFRVMKGKSKDVRRASMRRDEAYNHILTVRSVMNALQRQGVDVGSVQSTLKLAKDAMSDGDYDRTADLCDKAKDELTKVRKPAATSGATRTLRGDDDARRRLEDVAEDIVAAKRVPPPPSADSYTGTKLPAESGPNYLSAKFELSTARSELAMASDGGKDVSVPKSLVAQSQNEFDAGNYSKALSLALRARKGLSEEVSKETIPLKVRDEGVEEMPEPDIEEPEAERGPLGAPECRVCSSMLDLDDVFCSKCGTKVPKERKCPSCGTKPRGEDSFCRKCGTKVP